MLRSRVNGVVAAGRVDELVDALVHGIQRRQEDLVAAREVPVERRLRDPGRGGNALGGCALNAVGGDELQRHLHDLRLAFLSGQPLRCHFQDAPRRRDEGGGRRRGSPGHGAFLPRQTELPVHARHASGITGRMRWDGWSFSW